jgi:hypothetical protein
MDGFANCIAVASTIIAPRTSGGNFLTVRRDCRFSSSMASSGKSSKCWSIASCNNSCSDFSSW